MGDESASLGTIVPFLFVFSFFYFSSFRIYMHTIYIYLSILDQAQNNLNKIKCDSKQNYALA
jgi:hypothetical protein